MLEFTRCSLKRGWIVGLGHDAQAVRLDFAEMLEAGGAIMAKATHVKADAAQFPVPQSRDEVNEAIARIGLLQRERARMQADMNDELAKVRLRFEEAATPSASSSRS
ncbi:hypothetical protein ACE0DR_07035 [Azotobacter sp. CWF10]